MSLVHISTPETFLVDAIELDDALCPICGLRGKHRFGWTGGHCSVCNVYYPDELWMGLTVKMRREAMNMKRKDFASLLGITRKSLANIEFCICSKRAFDKSLEIFQAHVKARKS